MKLNNSLLGVIGLPIVIALATTGCATKKYARQQANEQAGVVNQRVSEVEKNTNEKITGLGDKTQKDISRVEERAMTADNHAGEAAKAAQQADSRAQQADQAARTAQQLGQQNQSQIADLAAANNYKLIDTQDVLFAFNKATLTPEAKQRLDEIAQKASTMQRPVLEVEGFTDKTGSKDYNLALSRRRADAVVRYLVSHNVPLRSIHMIGLGSEQVAETQGNAANQQQPERMSAREMRKQARRVVIRVWAPQTSASAMNTPAQQGQAQQGLQAHVR